MVLKYYFGKSESHPFKQHLKVRVQVWKYLISNVIAIFPPKEVKYKVAIKEMLK